MTIIEMHLYIIVISTSFYNINTLKVIYNKPPL
jgi:hypothetical protein